MAILYHYCSTASFHAIVQSRALWLSSLSLSSDTMEGKLVASTIARLAEKDSLDKNLVRFLQETIGFLEKLTDGLGFCLSEEGDLLSQWRGYADDASGVAIGFSSEYLKWLSAATTDQDKFGLALQMVKYDLSEHEASVSPTYLEIRQLIKDGALKTIGGYTSLMLGGTDQELERENAAVLKARSKLSQVLLLLFPELFRLKAPAFREEREWRLLSHIVDFEKEDYLHRAMGNRIVPYRAIELIELVRKPITEVVLGPKHGTPPKIVKDFLARNHYGLVKVRRSDASYR